MRRTKGIAGAIAGGMVLVAAAGFAGAAGAAETAAGLWAQVDDATGRVRSHVRIAEQGGRYHGTIVRFFPSAGEPPHPVCDRCVGRLKNHPIVGLRFMTGLVRHDRDYRDGHLVDPDTGSVYSGTATLSADGQTLTLRGYVVSPLFGRSQTWRRID